MWTRHSRVIWLFLTKQHSQTQEFLLGLFSHHSSETGVWGEGGLGETGRETEWERERSGAMREETFLWHEAKYNYQRDMLLLRLHTSVRLKKKRRQFMDGEKEAEISWSEKFMISSEMSSAQSSLVSQGPEVPWPDWLSAWDWGAWLAVAHSRV